MKYMLTSEQVNYLSNMVSPNVARFLDDALKPIEPLSLETIRAFKSKYPAEDLCQWSYNMGAADAERYFIGLYGITC